MEVWVPKQSNEVARYVLTATTVRVVHQDGSEHVSPVYSFTGRVLRRVAVRVFRGRLQ